MIVLWPAYGREMSLRLAVARYVLVVGTGLVSLFGLHAIAASSVLMVAALLVVEFISFSRIT